MLFHEVLKAAMSKKKNSCYCIKCLRRWKIKKMAGHTQCPYCSVDLRFATERIAAIVCKGQASRRGIRIPKPRTDYEKYLRTSKWLSIRKRILVRDNHTCRMCNKKANQVHHRSYSQNVIDGCDDSSLISLCRGCHKYIHFDGKKRRSPQQG